MKLDTLKSKIQDKSRALKSPKQIIDDLMIRLDDKMQLIELNTKNLIKSIDEKIKSYGQILSNLSFKNVLKRGYSIVWSTDNHIISDAEILKNEDKFFIELASDKVEINKR